MSVKCALLPEVAGSTATPGMKWSTVLVVGSIGMRAGFVQVTPSAEVLKTRSFEEQFVRKRQSAQTTYTVPLASISADGMGPLRRWPASV